MRFSMPRKLSALDPQRLDNQICFAVYSAAHAFNRVYKPLLDRLGLTYPQYLVMLVLWERDDVPVKDIGEKLFLDSGTLTPLLKRLEAAHLVRRTRSREDERQVLIALTPQEPCLEGKSARRAAIDPGGVGLLGLGTGRDEGRDRGAAGSVECGDRGVGGAASSILSYLAASFSPQSRFFANARPEADFRYFSNATALASSLKAMQVLMRHGPYFDVCGTSPALCFASRARRSSVMPM
ncbi:hypothetical protein ACVWZR_003874 [Bradyrhizobium sp. i1.3.1]